MDSKQKQKKTNPDNGMKNSSPPAAQVGANLALDASGNQEPRSLVAAGLTHPEFDSAECGRNRALADSEFTLVMKSRNLNGYLIHLKPLMSKMRLSFRFLEL
jgi:hypothetical protein